MAGKEAKSGSKSNLEEKQKNGNSKVSKKNKTMQGQQKTKSTKEENVVARDPKTLVLENRLKSYCHNPSPSPSKSESKVQV